MEKATFAKNCTPILGTMWPPFTIMTGRPTILDDNHVEQLVQMTTQDPQYLHQTSVMDLLAMRRAIQETDAQQAIRKALAHPLREDARTIYNYGDAVQIYDSKRWAGTYRVLGTAGSSVIFQQANRIFKHPRCVVRLIISRSLNCEERTQSPNQSESAEIKSSDADLNPSIQAKSQKTRSPESRRPWCDHINCAPATPVLTGWV